VKKNGYTDDGIYTIFIGKRLTESLAYCKQQLHGGGWQVIQQRLYQGKYSQKIENNQGYQDGLGRPSPFSSLLLIKRRSSFRILEKNLIRNL